MSESIKIVTICIDQDSGKYSALRADDAAGVHGEGYSTQAAIVDLLCTSKIIEVIEK